MAGNWSTQRKPKQTKGEHTNPTHKGFEPMTTLLWGDSARRHCAALSWHWLLVTSPSEDDYQWHFVPQHCYILETTAKLQEKSEKHNNIKWNKQGFIKWCQPDGKRLLHLMNSQKMSALHWSWPGEKTEQCTFVSCCCFKLCYLHAAGILTSFANVKCHVWMQISPNKSYCVVLSEMSFLMSACRGILETIWERPSHHSQDLWCWLKSICMICLSSIVDFNSWNETSFPLFQHYKPWMMKLHYSRAKCWFCPLHPAAGSCVAQKSDGTC